MEIWDVYDINRERTGKTVSRGEYKFKEGEYSLGVDVWIINSKKQILIQKRSSNKKKYPDMWECSAGGAVISGEDSYQGCIRETQEELGIEPDMKNAKLIHRFVRNVHIYTDVYMIEQDVELSSIKMQEEEVSDVRWASFEEIKTMLNEGIFVPSIMEGFYKIEEIYNG